MEDSCTKQINTSRTETEQTVINMGEEKSLFERAIIEAYKQRSSSKINEKLSIAMDEIKFMVSEIKKSHGQTDIDPYSTTKKYLLNRNVVDKLSRIVQRKFFNVNVLIAKIIENLLDSNHFSLLSNDIDLLIHFSNEVLNLLEDIKSTIISRQLEKKCSSFLNYLLNLEGLNEEQKAIITEVLTGFPTRNCSEVYKNFDQIREKILTLSKNQSVEDKLEAINTLMENFGNTFSLEEQFDLLIDKLSNVIKAIIHQPNLDCKEAYFQLGNFICSILFATKFKVDAFMPDYRINSGDMSKNFFLFLVGDELVDETTRNEISFLHNTVFELSTQKEILLRCENIFHTCNLILNTLSIYDTIFDLQFVCYIILKRIYFTFPQFRKNIEDCLAVTLVNLCVFKDPFEVENSEECRVFLCYLLKFGEEELKHKIRKRLESRNLSIEGICNYEETVIADVETEFLKLSDFNLRIGYPCSYEIEAGGQMSKYIEVCNPNSLVYIGFATQSNDITFHLLKYVPENSDSLKNSLKEEDSEISNINTKEEIDEYTDKGHFKELLKMERVDSSLNPVKVVIFVPEPGTYKIVFDNSFSWFTGKMLRFRTSVLKPITEIDLERRADFGKILKERKKETQKLDLGAQIELQETTDSTHSNKILLVKTDGVNKSYNIGKLHQSENALRENKNNKYLTVPVLITKDSIRIYRTYTNEYGVEIEDYKESVVESEKSLALIFEQEVTNYLNTINEFEKKTIFVSTFIMEKQIEYDPNAIPIAITSDQKYKQIVHKMGFYPENLINKFQNLSFFLNSMADSCLLYILYQKVLNVENFNNLIHIHFDKYKSQSSLYFEGVINDKITGPNYDFSKTLLENQENVIDFVNKIIVIFGGFDLSVSFSDIEEKMCDQFIIELNSKLLTMETHVTLEKKDQKFLSSVLNHVHLFQMAS